MHPYFVFKYTCVTPTNTFLHMVVSHHMGARNWTRLFLTYAISPAPYYFIKSEYFTCRYVYALQMLLNACRAQPISFKRGVRKYHLDIGKRRKKKNQTQVLDKRNKCSSGAMLSFHFQYLNFFILSKYSGFWIYYGVLYVEVTCKLLLYRHSILT